MALFAQGEEAIVGFLLFYGVIFAVALGVHILFLLTMSRCLAQVSSRNRRMQPGEVWLCLIPIFGFAWTTIMILRIAESLDDEVYDRGLRGDGDYGKSFGIMCIVTAFLCGPIGLVCFVLYWVKIAGYTKTLATRGGYDDYDDREW